MNVRSKNHRKRWGRKRPALAGGIRRPGQPLVVRPAPSAGGRQS